MQITKYTSIHVCVCVSVFLFFKTKWFISLGGALEVTWSGKEKEKRKWHQDRKLGIYNVLSHHFRWFCLNLDPTRYSPWLFCPETAILSSSGDISPLFSICKFYREINIIKHITYGSKKQRSNWRKAADINEEKE